MCYGMQNYKTILVLLRKLKKTKVLHGIERHEGSPNTMWLHNIINHRVLTPKQLRPGIYVYCLA